MNGHTVHPVTTDSEPSLTYSYLLLMASSKGLTLKDFNWINSKCRSIAKMERHGIHETHLRNELYVLGVYAFRHFHNADMPADILHPSLNPQGVSASGAAVV